MTAVSVRTPTEERFWATEGACAQLDPDEFFVRGADQQRVKQFCRGCPVLNHCLADALNNRIEFGVWGGMTERERRRLLRQHPGVVDWLDVLEAAHEKTA
ncbi:MULTISPECIES: WhiB family transcriptional regulator [Helcobacillus]|uniref:Transcriptional regulator WhiB n=1 Tax=Helcobacillus massiliensis TaxID=521392 RepID=A0A839QWM1_9MICO|nr:WhiB family transcriptional regulator [Helcobacillus massiliensis]MBB3023190.1 WhiB family redox-sensing transcriptional regulator [Helcobacillus massiliensis]MDK7742030.1 WhiB family transcriptional regulator [Helcobacillus massiliensis]WOO93061.1 WhiB family transcriptional regulator [Helcobacillus massiliensis]